jgi:hypothetical protein
MRPPLCVCMRAFARVRGVGEGREREYEVWWLLKTYSDKSSQNILVESKVLRSFPKLFGHEKYARQACSKRDFGISYLVTT